MLETVVISKDYTRYSIVFRSEEEKEILIALLSDWGIEGFEETEDILYASGNNSMVEEVEIDDYLDKLGYYYTKETVPDKNWNEVWESNFEPVHVDDFVGIRAGFHPPMQGVTHEIVITPKMSFGTGHHATTYLVMQLMRQLDFTNTSVFDFGTGTGILAILAEKLGATEVLAVDYDDWCIANADENIAQNACINIILDKGDVPPVKQNFDIVLANINKNIILENLQQLVNNTKNNGFLLLSGLLVADEADILAQMEKYDLDLRKKIEKSGWIALLFRKADFKVGV